MSSNANLTQAGSPPSGARGIAGRVCVICRRALAADDVALDLGGVTVHLGCAVHRRRRVRR